MQLIEAEKTDFISSTERLRQMEVSPKQALEVARDDAPSVRTVISRLHAETEQRYTTKKTKSGILVWRVK
jgi:uncharacterized protein (DUF2249 family)